MHLPLIERDAFNVATRTCDEVGPQRYQAILTRTVQGRVIVAATGLPKDRIFEALNSLFEVVSQWLS